MPFDSAGMENYSASPRPRSTQRVRGSAHEMRMSAKDASFDTKVQPVEVNESIVTEIELLESELSVEDEHGSEEVSLDSVEAIDDFYSKTFADFKEELERTHPELDLADSDLALLHERFRPLKDALRVLQNKLTSGEEILQPEIEQVQLAHDTAVHEPIELTEVVAHEVFDPNSYIEEQFAAHGYLIPSERSPVYLLQSEYKRAVAEGATGDAEKLAEQIKAHVDELVGNDQVEEVGIGADLSLDKKGTELKLKELDTEDQKVEVHVPKTRLENLIALHGEEVGGDLYESEAVRVNLAKEIEKDRVKSEQNTQSETKEIETVVETDVVPEAAPLVLEEKDRVYPEDQAVIDQVIDRVSNPEPLVLQQEDLVEEGDQAVIDRVLHRIGASDQVVSETISSRESLREAKEYEKKAQREIETIENLLTGGFMSRFLIADQSPYEQLGDEDFEGLVLNSQAPYVDSFKRAQFFAEKNIDKTALENWIREIENRGLETAGRTFKEVADDLVKERIAEGNTQSA